MAKALHAARARIGHAAVQRDSDVRGSAARGAAWKHAGLLGTELHLFAGRAGQRKGEYEYELAQLERPIAHLESLRGAFDIMYQPSSP